MLPSPTPYLTGLLIVVYSLYIQFVLLLKPFVQQQVLPAKFPVPVQSEAASVEAVQIQSAVVQVVVSG